MKTKLVTEQSVCRLTGNQLVDVRDSDNFRWFIYLSAEGKHVQVYIDKKKCNTELWHQVGTFVYIRKYNYIITSSGMYIVCPKLIRDVEKNKFGSYKKKDV